MTTIVPEVRPSARPLGGPASARRADRGAVRSGGEPGSSGEARNLSLSLYIYIYIYRERERERDRSREIILYAIRLPRFRCVPLELRSGSCRCALVGVPCRLRMLSIFGTFDNMLKLTVSPQAKRAEIASAIITKHRAATKDNVKLHRLHM